MVISSSIKQTKLFTKIKTAKGRTPIQYTTLDAQKPEVISCAANRLAVPALKL